MSRVLSGLVAALVLSACADASVPTQGGQLRLSDAAVVDLGGDDGPNPFLEGQAFCPDYACALAEGCPSLPTVADCISPTWVPGEGAEPSFRGDCVVFSTPGAYALELAPVACGEPASTPFVADRLDFEAVPAELVEGHTALYYEALLASEEPDPEEGKLERPDDWLPADDAPWRVVRDEWMTFHVHLRHRETGSPVAWSAATWSVSGSSVIDLDQTVENAVRVMPRGEDEQELVLTTDAGSFVVTRFQPVAATEIASLELATLELTSPGAEGSVYARAVTKDAQGRVILGAPIVWSAEQMVITTGSPGQDYAVVVDLCRDRAATPDEVTVHLRASLGLLSDTYELRYTFTPPEEPNPDFAPDPRCTDRCGCAPGPEAGGAALAFGLGALAWARWRGRTRPR